MVAYFLINQIFMDAWQLDVTIVYLNCQCES